MLESADGLGLADSVGAMLYGSTEEYHIMWRYWKFMVRTLMYFPSEMADIGWSFLLTILCYAGKWCALVCLMAVNP